MCQANRALDTPALDTPIANEVAELRVRRRRADALPYPLPRSTRIIAVSNQKGGVGKTTTAVNVAAALLKSGARVLLIDFDPQGNASMAAGSTNNPTSGSIYHAMLGTKDLDELVRHDALDYIPANISLSAAELELAGLPRGEFRLSDALSEYFSSHPGSFHYVIIDCPPSLGMLTVNALCAATELLIPVQCEYYSLEGLRQLLNTIGTVRSRLNSRLATFNIVLTLFDSRTKLASDVASEVCKHFSNSVLATRIPRTVRLAEAPGWGKTVIDFDGNSLGAIAYRELASELALRDPEKNDF
ncbi:ParA family protein [Tropheryma whipplei]|uniref:ParA family protein n=1 Tax=Tropheryma whipplei TaxID=2039 RepID=UPI0004AC8D41|nr:AAA family ATPase [Tropheryma whipplei]